ncbi:MAG: TetR/AcrR family transcriptional regulator [Polyangiales bacterium]
MDQRSAVAAPVGNDKRERILNAAIKVFAKNGFYATRVSDIAKAAGVADGTIYLYFKNKDDVLITVFDEGINRLLHILRDAVASSPNVETRITHIIELQLGLLQDQRDLAEVITVNLRQSSQSAQAPAAPLFMQYLELIATVIRDCQKSGETRSAINARVAARALWGGLDGLLLT